MDFKVIFGDKKTAMECSLNYFHDRGYKTQKDLTNESVALYENRVYTKFISDVELLSAIRLEMRKLKDSPINDGEDRYVDYKEGRIKLFRQREATVYEVTVEGEISCQAIVIGYTDGEVYVKFRNIIFPSKSAREEVLAAIKIGYAKETEFDDIRSIDIDETRKSEGIFSITVSYSDETTGKYEARYMGLNQLNLEEIIDGERAYVKSPKKAKLVRKKFFDTYSNEEIPVYKRTNVIKEGLTPYGRLKNHEQFCFYSCLENQSLLETYKIENKTVKRTFVLSSLNDATAFEADVLTWLNTLRYVTFEMIADLFEAMLISDTGIFYDHKTFTSRLHLMVIHGFMDSLKFVNVKQEGELSQSSTTVYTLGSNGNDFLRELGRDHRYNAFERFQDANTVKSILACNQWLLYWLCSYPDEFINNHNAEKVLYIRGVRSTGIRFNATITRNDTMIIGQPVRRNDKLKSYEEVILNKFERFMQILSAPKDSVFSAYEQVEFPNKHILCYICEDDEHIQSVYEALLPMLEKYPDMEVWFTCDIRLYNYNCEGERFIVFNKNGNKEFVDINSRLMLGKERSYINEECERQTVSDD